MGVIRSGGLLVWSASFELGIFSLIALPILSLHKLISKQGVRAFEWARLVARWGTIKKSLIIFIGYGAFFIPLFLIIELRGVLVLKSQIATSKRGRGGKQKQPLVFTENGVAMLSSVLKSKQAVQVNISIMRIFTKLRSFLMLEKENSKKIGSLERVSNQLFKVVFERRDNLEDELPTHSKDRNRIGLKNKN